MSRRHSGRQLAALVLAHFVYSAAVYADNGAAFDIKSASLEELMHIDVYTAARRLEPLHGVPSAVFVLTREDIRRSRALTLPEVLRQVPGVNVARVDASRWAVSIRGFNERITHNLQVLVDGRSIYDPLFAGVFWEAQEMLLEDIERIEVIRGPGGTLWGPNAMNGVINIITRHARDTQGTLAVAGAGTEERAFGAARQGWQPAEDQYARVYAKGFSRDAGFAGDFDPRDDARMGRAGFRWDARTGARDELMVSGDFYDGVGGLNLHPQAAPLVPSLAQDIDLRGSNVLARWVRRRSPTEGLRLQFAYDHTVQDARQIGLDARRDTFDLEFQHDLQPAPRHRVAWGLGYRRTNDELTTVPPGLVAPARRNDASAYLFLRDGIALVPGRWELVLGTKVENTDYSGTEWQPSLRLAWTPNARETWWGAISRAVRVPARLERDLLGGSGFGDVFAPEELTAYEAGYRHLVGPRFWYDAAVFYNVYDDLRTTETAPLLQLRNFMRGRTYGAEVAARWAPMPRLRLDAAYSWLQMDLETDPASTADAQASAIEGSSPSQQLVLRALYDPALHWEIDVALRFVDELEAVGIPGYTALDLGVAWHPRAGLELALVGQNLLDSHHPEQIFEGTNGVATEVQRAVYARFTYGF